MSFKPDKNNNTNEENLCYEVPESFSFAQYGRPLLAANCSEYVVAHANAPLQPARQLSEVSFLPHILGAMRRLRFTHLLRLQSYAWPFLSQGGTDHGAVIVSAPRSGRTLSYVPPLCQVVCTTLAERCCRPQRWDLQGAVALVLAADLERVHQIGSLCNAMLRKAKDEEESLTLVLTVPSGCTAEFFQRLLNGVGCLVATPAQFLWLCGKSIKWPYLRFVVYDDEDLMAAGQLQKAHQQLLSLTKQQRPRLVITTQSYKPQLLQMLREFNSQHMLLFGDVLEAAVYGGTRMRIVLLKQAVKHEELLRVLGERPPHICRTVINCQTDAHIRELVETLQAHGYGCLPYYQTADWAVREQVNRWMQSSHGELLLCTDQCPELAVRHAHTLIHYSLSNSWSLFKLRHLALADNLRNQLAEQKDDKRGSLLSLVFLDESNNNQLPRLVDFLQMHQQVDARVVQLARQIRDRLERDKCDEPPLCDVLLSLGDCVGANCDQRHQLLPHESQLPARLSAGSDVKLQLLRVYTPAHYCVRLLEHLPPGGSWQPVPRQAALELQLQLLQSRECLRHWPPQAKEICVYRNANGYERVRILRVAPIALLNLSRSDVAVEVQAIDVDTRQFSTISGKLFECPSQLRDVPPLALDVRIVGLVPFTGERSWHPTDAGQCEAWLNAVPQPNFLQAHVVAALSHTLFVSDLAVTSYAPSLKLHVRRLTLCQRLLLNKLAKKSQQAVDKLLEFLQEDTSQADVEQQQLPRVQLEKSQLTTTTALGSRCGFFAKMALQLGKENQLREERKKLQQEVVIKPKSQEEQPLPKSEQSVEALYNCIMNCTLLELTEQDAQQSQLNDNVPQALLRQVMQPQQQELPTPAQHKSTPKTTTKITKDCNDNIQDLLQPLPPNVLRPEVSYYQTRCTLELQILLPEDHLNYEAQLHNGCCIAFWTLSTPSYQFIVNTHCAHLQLSHRICGRTVYVSVLKALAVPYPFDFGFYKFMKAHLEKLHQFEAARRERIADFEAQLLHMGYIRGRVAKKETSSDELSSDEQSDESPFDPSAERVERPRHVKELHWD